MKVLFFYSLARIGNVERPIALQETIALGIAYISAVLRQNGHDTSLVVLLRKRRRQENERQVMRAIAAFSPDVACFSLVYTEFEFMTKMAACVKRVCPSIKTIAGGAHPTLDPESVMARGVFDVVCVGEGEHPVLEYVQALQEGRLPSGIPNLWIRNGETFESNSPRPFFPDLDQLPFPDRDIWQPWIEDQSRRRFSVLLGRGCPFLCTYCSNHALRKVASGNYVRLRSVRNVVDEVRSLAQRYKTLEEIYFEVETIGTDMKWALDLCEELARFNAERSIPISFGVNLRITPNLPMGSLFAALQKASFRFVNIGVEAGSERVRHTLLNRHYSNRDISRAVDLARQHRLQVCFFCMLGIPGETESDFLETLEIIRTCQPDWYYLSIFYPYPGTELYRRCEDMGARLDAAVSFEQRDVALDLPTFPKQRIRYQFLWFEYNIRKGYQPMVRLLARTLVKFLLTSSPAATVYRFISRNRAIRSCIDWLKSL